MFALSYAFLENVILLEHAPLQYHKSTKITYNTMKALNKLYSTRCRTTIINKLHYANFKSNNK